MHKLVHVALGGFLNIMTNKGTECRRREYANLSATSKTHTIVGKIKMFAIVKSIF